MRSGFQLLSLGLVWGLVVPLSALASSLGAKPFTLTAWVAAVSAILCLSFALARGRKAVLSTSNVLFFLLWAVLGTVLPQTLLFWVSGRIAASTISIVAVLEGFIVFGLAAILRLETPTLRRFAGLTLGLVGTVPVLAGAQTLPNLSLPITILGALGIPLCYAVENLLISSCKPRDVDPIAGVGIMQATGAIIAFAFAVQFDDNVWPSLGFGRLEAVVLLLGLCAAVANYLFQSLISSTGSVFAGQCAYLITLAGIGWSMVLLDETVSPWIGLGLAPIFFGILLVTPRRQPA